MSDEYPDTFEGDCMKYRRRILTGKYAHTCWDWDGLPIDETCEEWPCACQADLEKQVKELEAKLPVRPSPVRRGLLL